MTGNFVPPGLQTFFDLVGVPLSLGTVAHYIPGTLTPSDTWADVAQTTLNQNPLTLDSLGRAPIFGVGQYRQIVKDTKGNTVWDRVVIATDLLRTDLSATTGAGLIGFLHPRANAVATTLAEKGQRVIDVME